MSGFKNRARLLHLIEILHTETDEDHFLTLKDIRERIQFILEEPVSQNAITNDIRFLSERYRVTEETLAHGEKQYSMPRSEFDIHELRILVDSVAAARSITRAETKNLIRKIKSLTSRHMGKKLENQIYLNDRIKESNDALKYYITQIHESISDQHKITFQYAKFTPAKKRELLHGGKVYVISPYALIWSNDYYYLVGHDDDGNIVKSFRVDRMQHVTTTNLKFRRPEFNVADYVNKSFNMYSGPSEYIEVEFDNHLINVVIDRFGPKVRTTYVGDKTFRIRVEAGINEGLIRWLLTWGSDAKVISPATLVQRMKNEVQKMITRYAGE